MIYSLQKSRQAKVTGRTGLIEHPQIAPHKPIGGEMELYQIAEAAVQSGKRWLLAKAICDFVSSLDGVKDKEGQPVAVAVDLVDWLLRQAAMESYFL